MRSWASWTAKTAVFSLAAGLAATAVGSAAWAASGSGASAARGVSAASAARGSSAALAARGGGPALAAHGGGTGPGTTTTVTNATGPVSGSLPTTGADLLLLGVQLRMCGLGV